MKKLNDKQKAKVMKAAYFEVSMLLSEDNYADPFKHRELPLLPESLYDEADKYFFVCIKAIEKEMRAKSK